MANRKIIHVNSIIENEPVESLAEVPVEKLTPWPHNDKLKFVGKPFNRVDGYDKVSGSAVYTFDKSLPNMAYAKTLRSPHPHAMNRKLDISRASQLPGVLHIIHAENTPDISWYWYSKLFDKHLR